MTMENVKQANRLAALPIISVEPFLHPDGHPGKLSTAAALHAACSQYGFFYLDISSYADPSEPEELTRLAREFFALRPEKKDEISISKEDGARGAQIRPCLMTCTRQSMFRLSATAGECDKWESGQPRSNRLFPPNGQAGQDETPRGREPVAGCPGLQGEIRSMGGEDEEARDDCYGSVSTLTASSMVCPIIEHVF